MAIVAYASGDPNPVGNPHVDPTVDLSSVSLPQDVQLYAGCVDDSGDPGPFTYQWYVMAKQPGSLVAFDDPTSASPLLENVDIWGNVRVFVVATNTGTGETSQQDPLRAPSSAFAVVRVLSANQTIQKPAYGERNWFDDVWDWAQRIEDFTGGLSPHKIIEHTDVTDATGHDLEQLTGGGYAVDPEPAATGQPANPPDSFGNSVLHRHYGSDVDVATTTTPGTIYLDPGFTGDPAAPTAITNDFAQLSAHSFHCHHPTLGVVDKVCVGRAAPGGSKECLFVWNLPPGTNGQWMVRNYAVHFNAVGPKPDRYQFELVLGAHANPLSLAAIAGSSFNMPALYSSTQLGFAHWGDWAHQSNGGAPGNIGAVVGGTHWLGFRVVADTVIPEDMAQGITVTVFLQRIT